MKPKKSGIILALDTQTVGDALRILEKTGNAIKYVKVGYRLFFMGGTTLVKKLQEMGYHVFLDLKLHDIPNTVGISLDPLFDMDLWLLTLHSAGGRKMLEEAVAVKCRKKSSTLLLGVTILTSHSERTWQEVNPGSPFIETLTRRATLCHDCGLDGLVCSPGDLLSVNKTVTWDFPKVVPGIRLKKCSDDQTRVSTPKEAVINGAHFLVIGRPILQASEPLRIIDTIKKQIKEAHHELDQR